MPAHRTQISFPVAFNAEQRSGVQRIALRAIPSLARTTALTLFAGRFLHRY